MAMGDKQARAIAAATTGPAYEGPEPDGPGLQCQCPTVSDIPSTVGSGFFHPMPAAVGAIREAWAVHSIGLW